MPPWQLLAPNELTPGISAEEYRLRRQRLADMLPHGAVAVLPAAATTYMAGVIPWPYRQVGPQLCCWLRTDN